MRSLKSTKRPASRDPLVEDLNSINKSHFWSLIYWTLKAQSSRIAHRDQQIIAYSIPFTVRDHTLGSSCFKTSLCWVFKIHKDPCARSLTYTWALTILPCVAVVLVGASNVNDSSITQSTVYKYRYHVGQVLLLSWLTVTRYWRAWFASIAVANASQNSIADIKYTHTHIHMQCRP